ncbi:hypothetical protein DUI87_22751 [Hirundo rustica rustica]|uniref:Peptidase A2 domain-containing protein n=1 Tax=Hirundo rustica rustica TaxID=333673 RepID=A0A3M0JNU9_HIRRU|nr:hypothetical protein DUI87_22751 [Hirundo rustica rustica]
MWSALPGEKRAAPEHLQSPLQVVDRRPQASLDPRRATIRDLCKVHKDYGQESPYFRSLLCTNLSAAAVIPSDLKQLFSCLMNSMEFKLWEAAWKQLLRDALPGLLIDPDTVVDENGKPLTFDNLTDPPPTLQDMLWVCQFKVPFMQTITPLQLSKGLHLSGGDWTFISVNSEEQGAWPSTEGEFIVIGSCKHVPPQEIEVLPGMLVTNPGSLVPWLRCTHPPTYLPKGQIIVQMIPTWGPSNNRNIPTACPVQAVREERPQVACEFSVGGEALKITGLLDTRVDVTIVPTRYWLSHWALQEVAGHVQGVEGIQLARQLKSMVQIKGLKGQLANIHPFVLDYKEPLLGRDLMAQWRIKIDIPNPSQDFWTAAAERRPTQKLNWLTDSPV